MRSGRPVAPDGFEADGAHGSVTRRTSDRPSSPQVSAHMSAQCRTAGRGSGRGTRAEHALQCIAHHPHTRYRHRNCGGTTLYYISLTLCQSHRPVHRNRRGATRQLSPLALRPILACRMAPLPHTILHVRLCLCARACVRACVTRIAHSQSQSPRSASRAHSRPRTRALACSPWRRSLLLSAALDDLGDEVLLLDGVGILDAHVLEHGLELLDAQRD